MSPRERFIEVAVEPLADNAELQVAARQQLEEELSPRAADGDLEEAVARLERAGRGRWRWVWAVGVLGVSTACFLMGGNLVGGLKVLQGIGGAPVMAGPAPPIEPHFGMRSEDERLLLFGEPGRGGEAAVWRPLWESDPDNPMFYIEYALAYEAEFGRLPQDFLETGRELDPDNGWFALKVAEVDFESVVERPRSTTRRKEDGEANPVTLKDEVELQRRIELFKRACSSPTIDSYQNVLRTRRFGLIPEPEEFTDYLMAATYAAGQRMDLLGRGLSILVEAEAQRCGREGDREGFLELARAWEVWISGSIDGAEHLIEGLIAYSTMRSTLPAMRDAAVELDVDPERWRLLETAVRERKQRLEERSDPKHDEAVDLLNRHGSMLASLAMPMTAKMVAAPPGFGKADLLPGCRVDQAFIGRLLAAAGWLVTGLFALGSFVIGSAQSPLWKGTMVSLGRLPAGADALWIGLGGVVTPWILYLGLRYGTSLSRLDWGPRLTLYAVPVSHFVGLLLMLLVWPVAIASWRVARAGRVFGWKRAGWWTISAMIAPLVGMLCFSFAVPPGSQSMALGVVGLACGAWSLSWLLVQAGLSAFGKVEKRLYRRLTARTARPAWVGGLLVMATLAVVFRVEERRWMARNELMRITPAFFAYEDRVTDQMKRELRGLME